MKKGTLMKRTMSILLTFMLIVTMMPASMRIAFAEDVEQQKPANQTAVFVKWQNEQKDKEAAEKGKMLLEAALTQEQTETEAVDITVKLSKEETEFLKDFRDKDGNLSEEIVINSEAKIPISLEIDTDGSANIKFVLNKEFPALKTYIEFEVPEAKKTASGSVQIEVNEDDIVVEEYKDPAVIEESEEIMKDADTEEPKETEENKEIKLVDADKTTDILQLKWEAKPAPKAKESIVPAAFDRDVTINEYMEAYEQSIFWADNNNEKSNRPTVEKYAKPVIKFSMDGKDFKELTADDLSKLGLSAMPKTTVSRVDESRQYKYNIDSKQLPTKVTYTDSYGDTEVHNISWKIEPQDVAEYKLINVTKDNVGDYKTANGQIGWYYLLETDFEFDLIVRWGKLGSDENKKAQIVKDLNIQLADQFGLFALGGADMASKAFSTLRNVSNKGAVIEEELINSDKADNAGTVRVRIKGLWKYNLDGSKMAYNIREITSDDDSDFKDPDGIGIVKVGGIPADDYFAVKYDNDNVSNVGHHAEAVYPGGQMKLTLTGKTTYEAHKEWLDDNGKRPAGEFHLWRYRAGESFTSAAPVRDDKGNIMSVDLNTGDKEQTIKFEDLEKYDSEGHEYFYAVREYLDGVTAGGDKPDEYEQVFGKVREDADGNISVTDRKDVNGVIKDIKNPADNRGRNVFVYNGGTLSNRVIGNDTVEATKIWRAAAFQALFKDVAVELKLQSKPENNNEAWKDTGITERFDTFQLEHLSLSCSKTMPRYDEFGQKLVYRWVESGVYQGKDSDLNLLKKDTDNEALGRFELNQGGKKILYESASNLEEGSNSTIIENTIANKVKFDVEKIWIEDGKVVNDEKTGSEITFYIYRNNGNAGLGTEVAGFNMDGKVDADKTEVNKELGIYAQEIAPWKAIVTPLSEYDKNGCRYEYTVLERPVKGYYTEYNTQKDPITGNYSAQINNIKVGEESYQIMVHKNWIDDSNITSREPVTLGVYEKGTNKLISEVVISAKNGEEESDNGWSAIVGIGKVKPDDVYILEHKVGDNPVSKIKADGTAVENKKEPDEPNLYRGDNDNKFTADKFQTKDHMYKAVYEKDIIQGQTVFSIDNIRTGDINLIVNKKWVDGDKKIREDLNQKLKDINKNGTRLKLGIKVKFADEDRPDYYKIEHSGTDKTDTVNVGNIDGDVPIMAPIENTGVNGTTEVKLYPASYVQAIDLGSDSSSCYFYNLPKYDRTGKVVHYEPEEIWVNGQGDEISLETLQNKYPEVYELWKEYRTSYSEEKYIVGDLHTGDTQEYNVENKLSATKNIMWHKQWNDEYAYKTGVRPDIYLDVYQKKHVTKDDIRINIYEKNYKWTFETASVNEAGNAEHHWHAEIKNVPKYDDLGYEIKYYADEHSNIDKENFDYDTAKYYMSDDCILDDKDTYVGDRYNIDPESKDNQVIEVPRVLTSDDDGKLSNYALVEGGTFNNILKGTAVVSGEKLWSSLPAGYPEVNLPAVKFTLMQSLEDGTGSEKAIATVTVNKWADTDKNGSYDFGVKYVGENVVDIGENGEVIINPAPGNENAEALPKYNHKGQMYKYSLKESNIIWPGEGNESTLEDSKVYKGSMNTYLAENVYDSVKGALSLKKYLVLPMNDEGTPKAYPAVKFELSRTYVGNDGKPSTPEVVDTLTWDSANVKDEYNRSTGIFSKIKAFFTGAEIKAGTEAQPLEKILTFEDLDIYAPNGSKYVYSVREVKDDLGGYDTWAKDGNLGAVEVKDGNTKGVLEIGGLDLAINKDEGRGETDDAVVKATFLNSPTVERETVTLNGTKNWNDFDNVFKTRPELNLEVYRSASAQPGQDNAIDKTQVTQSLYDVTWTNTEDNQNKQTYVIKGKGNSGELEKYAPNGMPWKYYVKEVADDSNADNIYTSDPKNGEVAEASHDVENDNDITMKNLTNSITTSAPYSKVWVDEDNKPVKDDYLGFDITVGFKLQVAEVTENADGESNVIGQWQDAGGDSGYFKSQLGDAYDKVFAKGYSFEATKSGRINDAVMWNKKQSFNNLPGVIKKSEDMEFTTLTYRVVETGISYGKDADGNSAFKQDVTVKETADSGNREYTYEFGNGLFSSAYPNGKDSYRDTDTTVYNMLETKDLEVSKTWENDKDNIYGTRPDTGRNNYNWQTGFVIQKSTDGKDWSNVKVYNGDVGKDLTIMLYGKNADKTVKATISKLPSADNEGKPYSYRARELQPGEGVDSVITGGSENSRFNGTYDVTYDTENPGAVTNTLKDTEIYAEKIWNEGAKPKNVKFEVQYLGSDGQYKSFAKRAIVEVDGNAVNNTDAYCEYESWKAVWHNLPESIVGSKLDDNGKTQYRVIEHSLGNGYIQESVEKTTVNINGANYTQFKFTNNESVSMTVQKNWFGIGQSEQQEIKVAIYSKTGENNAEKIKTDVTLNSGNSWRATIKDLPKYDNNGDLYTYYAKELSIGDKPVDSYDYRIIYDDTNNGSSFGTVIKNIGRIEIAGTKTWKDNSNKYDTRPADLELTLYRSINGGKAEAVSEETMKAEGITLTWTDKQTDVWNYKYTGLPKTDHNGRAYVYKVDEKPVVVSKGNDKYEGDKVGNNFTNTLTDTIEISVKKIWNDRGDKYNYRPKSITVQLYANGKVKDTATLTGKNSIGEDNNTWSYKFKNLPEYDADGVRIKYEVKEETVPEGYKDTVDVKDGDVEIKNTKLGGFIDFVYAEKVWNKSAESKDVTLELKYKGTDGQWKSMKNPALVTLDGKKDNIESAYYEYDDWKAVWKDIPKVIPGSAISENGSTQYKIFEHDLGDGYIQESVKITNQTEGTGSDAREYAEFVFENNESINLTVEKQWHGIDSEDQKEIVVGLWRTTGAVGDNNSEKVMEKDASGADVQATAVLNKDSSWKASFKDLSKYDDNGEAYKYFARELTIGGNPVNDYNYYIVNSDEQEDDGSYSTGITNIGRTELTGSKTWVDNSNAYGTRPADLELTLYRSIDGSEAEAVSEETMKAEGITLTWADKDTDVWTYTYSNLPKTDNDGNDYTYSVRENDVEAGIEGDEYKPEQKDNDFTNTLNDTIEIPVTKIWKDRNDKYDYRPESITVILYGNDEEVAHYDLAGADNPIEELWKEITDKTDEWSYTFEDLPEYDENGVRIEYRVEEIVPDGYDAFIKGSSDEGFNIENTKHGGLIVSKTVDGNAGDKDKEFHFTVELSDKNINGIYGDMQFVNGVADIILKDGQSLAAEELPADINYIVTEVEANADGYSTSSDNAAGVIPAGDNAEVKYINTKNIYPTEDDDKTNTGDSMNFGIPTALMGLSLAGIIAAFVGRKRRKQ